MSFELGNVLVTLGANDALSVLLKVTLLLGLASLASVLLRNRSAALRHFVWLLALTASLALPLLAPAPQPIAVSTPYWPALANEAPITTVTPGSSVTSVWVGGVSHPVTVKSHPPRVEHRQQPTRLASAPPIPLIWLVGVLLVLAWQALGLFGLRRLSRKTSLVADPRWHWILGDCARRTGVRRSVELRKSAAVGSPLLCGVLQPTIVLPIEAEHWPEDRRRAVALHELAHVARHDALAQRIAGVACALYWFHPAVWMAAGRMRAESERACDDRVLRLGFPAAEYAAQLLEVMKTARILRLSGAVAIGMANRSTLEGRLLALFQPRNREALTARVRAVGLGAFLLLLIAVAGIRPVARASASAASATTTPSSDSDALAFKNEDKDEEDEGERIPYNGTFEIGSGGTLVLRLDTGASIVVRGWDQRRVQIDGYAGGVDARRVGVNMNKEGKEVSLVLRQKGSSNNFSSSSRFEIHVPRRFDIELKSSGGELSVQGIEGTIRGYTGGGDIHLSQLHGSTRLSTGGGTIEVSDSDLSGTVSTGGGTVRIERVKGGLKGTSGSGPVIYTETGRDGEVGDLEGVEIDASGSVITIRGENERKKGPSGSGVLNVEKAGGPIQLESIPHGARISTGGGDLDIGRSAGMVRATTGGGNMRFGPVMGSLEAATGAGDVHIALGDADVSRTVEASSGKGVIVLTVPSGLGVEFDLETGYTSTRFLSHIVSDFALEREPTTGWDDREGTPRRYVRAHGRIGSGQVKVHLKTLNGDIEIRRR